MANTCVANTQAKLFSLQMEKYKHTRTNVINIGNTTIFITHFKVSIIFTTSGKVLFALQRQKKHVNIVYRNLAISTKSMYPKKFIHTSHWFENNL